MIETTQKSNCGQRGAALVTSIFALLILTLLGLSLVKIAESGRSVSRNGTESTQAFYVAEAGLAHAAGLLKANGKDYSISTAIPTAGVSFGAGKYVVTVAPGPNADERLITSTGTGPNGASVTLKALYQFGGSTGSAAISINGDAVVNANLQVLGTLGIIHANGNMTLSGNNRSQEHYSATGTISAPAPQPCPNGSVTGAPPSCDASPDLRSGQSPISVPNISPTSFLAQSTYFLVPPNPSAMPAPISTATAPTTATIYNASGAVVASGCDTGGCWGGWTYNSTQGWVINSGSTLPAGTYYGYRSSIQCNRTFGSSSTPLGISFIADGHVSFSGGESFLTPSAILSGAKYAVVAGGDISISGANLNTTATEGVFYSRHQFALLGGQPRIYGMIYVYNESDGNLYNANPVARSGSTGFIATGDPQVIYNGSGSGGPSAAMTLKSWSEIRN